MMAERRESKDLTDRERDLLQRGVKMFRTTYGSQGAFASRANEWVADAERLLAEEPTSATSEVTSDPLVERLKAAILDIDAHADAMGEDEDGFVTGGYFISIGSLHRALGVIGHPAPKCRDCPGHDQHELRDANYGMWNAMQRACNHPEAWKDYVRPALNRYRTVAGGTDAEPT